MYLPVVSDGRLIVSPERLSAVEPNRVFVHAIRAAGGRRPIAWTIEGELPPGVTFDLPESADPEADADRVIQGASAIEGIWPVLVKATDARGKVAERPYAI